MAEDSEVATLRREIWNKASTTIHLCSIEDDVSISMYWGMFSPICELIRSSVNDEESIPSHLAVIGVKIAEMRSVLDASNLNEVIALNILQLFSDYVKYLKTTPTASATHSNVVEENEMLKSKVFKLETECESLKQAAEKSRMSREDFREILSTFDMEDMEIKRRKGAVAVVKSPLLDVSPLTDPIEKKTMEVRRSSRAKRNTYVTRTLTSIERTPVRRASTVDRSLFPPQSSTVDQSLFPPHSSTVDQSLFPPQFSPFPSDDTSTVALADLLGVLYGNGKEKKTEEVMKEEKGEEKIEEKMETRRSRRRRAESPAMHGMEDEGMERKKTCAENSLGVAVANGGGDEGKYKCPFDDCGRAFHKITTMGDHATSDHYWQGTLELSCSHCYDGFDNDKAFETHFMNCPLGEITTSVKWWDNQENESERDERLAMEKILLTCPHDGCGFVSKSKSRGVFKHISKAHRNDGRAFYRCECGMKRRTLHTMLYHRYSECRYSEIEWVIESPTARKKDEDEDEDCISIGGTSIG